MRVKKGDTIEIVTGKDQGKRGKIGRTLPKNGRVVVEGLNLIKRHRRGTQSKPGGIVEQPAPLDVSNVMLICPNCDLKTRIGMKVENGKKVRVCKKCHKEIK